MTLISIIRDRKKRDYSLMYDKKLEINEVSNIIKEEKIKSEKKKRTALELK